MKRKIKRLDKKDTPKSENLSVKDSIFFSENMPEENSENNSKIAMSDKIAFCLIAIVLLLGLLASTFAAEGFFGEPGEWHWQDSRMVMYMALGACVGIFYLSSKIEERIKNWKNRKR